MRKSAATLLVCAMATIASCSLASPELDLFFDKVGRLTIQTERVWRWFFIPDRADACLNMLRVYDDRKFVWEVRSKKCRESAFPITYGVVPEGFETVTKPQPLTRHKRYGISACGEYPLRTRLDFMLGSGSEPHVTRDREGENLVRSPNDRADEIRMAAIQRGEKIRDIEECTRLPVKD